MSETLNAFHRLLPAGIERVEIEERPQTSAAAPREASRQPRREGSHPSTPTVSPAPSPLPVRNSSRPTPQAEPEGAGGPCA